MSAMVLVMSIGSIEKVVGIGLLRALFPALRPLLLIHCSPPSRCIHLLLLY